MALYDAYGRVVKVTDLRQTLAAPTLSGVRRIWHDSMVSGLTPTRLAHILRAASDGDHGAYLTLAEEMEERDPHYSSVLSTRKRAVTSLPILVEAASDAPRDQELAQQIRDLCNRPAICQGMLALLDALGKGFAVAEIMWEKAQRWEPRELCWRDPHFFEFDRLNYREIRLRDEQNLAEGIALAPYKFLTHVPALKCGIPIRGGLARLVAWSYLFKNYTLKDWMGFIEIFGMPLRIGRYGPTAQESDIAILKSAVANLGSDAAAVLPESMKIEFETALSSTGSERLFEGAGNWLDQQVSKAVLGQTMTSDSGSSRAQAEVHNDVRLDIQRSDAGELAETLNRDLVKPYIDLNEGVQSAYPRICLHVVESEDVAALADSIAKLVPVGLQVGQQHVRDRLGLADPKPGEVLLSMPSPSPVSVFDEALTHRTTARRCRHCDSAYNVQDPVEDALEALEREALADWQMQVEPLLDQLRRLLGEVESLEQLRAELGTLMEPWDAADQTVIAALARHAFLARALGDGQDGGAGV